MLCKLSYSELCITSNFSFLKGASHPEEYIERAINFNLKSIAIADKNSISGVVKAYKALDESHLELKKNHKLSFTKLIPGVTLAKDQEFEITCLAKTKNGWKNICRILTLGKRKAKKGQCDTNYNDILKHKDDIVFLVHLL